jgi:hypothetical protein
MFYILRYVWPKNVEKKLKKSWKEIIEKVKKSGKKLEKPSRICSPEIITLKKPNIKQI